MIQTYLDLKNGNPKYLFWQSVCETQSFSHYALLPTCREVGDKSFMPLLTWGGAQKPFKGGPGKYPKRTEAKLCLKPVMWENT